MVVLKAMVVLSRKVTIASWILVCEKEKKEQTRQALEKAILCLVIEKGYEEVTVEEVCQKVGISRKTFFNYFSSKRAAVLGRSYIPSKEMFLKALESHPDSDYIDVITGCIEHGLTAEDASQEIRDLRKTAMLGSPEIFFRSNKSSLVLQPAIIETLHATSPSIPKDVKHLNCLLMKNVSLARQP